jgi:hypothetical protein
MMAQSDKELARISKKSLEDKPLKNRSREKINAPPAFDFDYLIKDEKEFEEMKREEIINYLSPEEKFTSR